MGDGAWSSIFGLFDQDEDENSSAQQQGHWDNRDNLIIVIDCSPSMFQLADDDDDDYLPFQKSIRCCISLLKNKIISSDRDLIGIVFFATEKSKNRSDFKHVYVFQELDQPDAPRILDLERFLGDDSCDDFRDNYGYSDQFSMNDVLWTCSNMFSQSNQKTANKRIMLFTNNDNPHTDNRTLQNQAITKARDLFDIGITIELMHMCPPGGSFDASLFYQDIINVDDDELVALPDASVKFEELQAKVNKKEHKKRSMASIPFTLADGVDMGINVYNLCRPTTKSSCVNLNSRTNEEVRIHTKYICKDTGSELMPTDIKYYQMFGGEKVIFEKEEVAEMKSFGEPGLLLMGFKPKKALKRYYHIKPSNFIYPDEKSVSGSTTLFSALLTKSLDKDVVPICRYIPRATSAPYFVALLPQKEKFDEHNNQVNPAGFHVIFLPFADDLRKLDYPEAVKATTEQISKAKEIIKKLTFPFKATNFENPSLQKHYRHLEGLALDRDGPEEIEDLTEPDTERLDRRAGALMEEFKTLVYPEGYNPGAKPAAKRKTPGEGAAAKRAKTENIDVREEAVKGRLSKLTVPVLKDFAKLSGITAGTKKADIIEAINEHLGI